LSKRTVFGIILAFTLVGFASLTSSLQQVKAATIVVPDNYSTIQEAVNAANNGDKISIRNGTYHEKVTINKALTLTGETKDNTVIEQLNVSCIGDVHLTNMCRSARNKKLNKHLGNRMPLSKSQYLL